MASNEVRANTTAAVGIATDNAAMHGTIETSEGQEEVREKEVPQTNYKRGLSAFGIPARRIKTTNNNNNGNKRAKLSGKTAADFVSSTQKEQGKSLNDSRQESHTRDSALYEFSSEDEKNERLAALLDSFDEKQVS